MQVLSRCIAIGLVFAFSTDALAQPSRGRNLVARGGHESWSGLEMLIDGKGASLIDNSRGECLRVRGLDNSDELNKLKTMIVQVVLVSTTKNLSYLSYADSLSLSKESGPNTKWKIVNFTEITIEKKRRGSNLYVDTKTQSFELEAINRPGFFLSVDAKGVLTLKEKRGHTIKITEEAVWDDLNDGK